MNNNTSILLNNTTQKLEQEAMRRLSPDALERYNNKHYTGIFEFKRKLEDVVMEHTGIRPKLEPQKPTAEVQETLVKIV